MKFFRKQKDQYQPIENIEYTEAQPTMVMAAGEFAGDPVSQFEQVIEAAPVEAVTLDAVELIEQPPVQTVSHHPLIVDIIAPWDLADTSQLAALQIDESAKHVEVTEVAGPALPEPLMMMPLSSVGNVNFAA